MEIKIYVNWYEKTILKDEEAKENYLSEWASELANDSYDFGNYLERNYTTLQLFYMTENEQINVQEQWYEECYDIAEEQFTNDFEEMILTIDDFTEKVLDIQLL